jgi:O-acetyl-ADP-ribose deacetylase (regulator of RNase III)
LSRTSGKSRYEDIESGLRALVQEVRQRQIRSIAIPPSGSGLGGLQWGRVKGMIEAASEDIPDVRVKF